MNGLPQAWQEMLNSETLRFMVRKLTEMIRDVPKLDWRAARISRRRLYGGAGTDRERF
jgi:hypothetical protein